jgi:GxxExxY protein
VTYSGEGVKTPMNTDERRARLDKVTEAIVGCAFKVSNTLGVGFLEKVYENALAVELRRAGLKVQQQYDVKVTYEGVVVGDYTTDLLVEDSIVVELKAASAIEAIHRAQCLNYLRAANLSVGLVINFGQPRLEVKRVVNAF